MPNTASLEKINNAYFVGIGGVSMSSLALILKSMGKNVSGYDMRHSDNTALLESNGIDIDYTHNITHLKDADTVVYTAAVSKETAPELQYAEDNDIALISRAQLLGAVTSAYRYSVGVSGTHGKSTTTGMITDIFMLHDKESSAISGCVIPSIGRSYKIGTSDRVVFEACEYKDSFLSMYPSFKIVLNCKLDHVDYFKNLDAIKESFKMFIDNPRPSDGKNTAIVNMDCENSLDCARNVNADVYFYSVDNEDADFVAERLHFNDGCGIFDVKFRGNTIIKELKLAVPGIHNVSNALAAIAASVLTDIEPQTIKNALENFRGVERRFERKGTYKDALIIDDYAHHPDEIEVTLKAAKALNKDRIICVFQPHTYSRTKALLKDFAKALSLADKVYLADIYPAREENIYNISSQNLADLIENAEFIGSFDEIADVLSNSVNANDLIITMGAGEAYKVGEILLAKK